MSNPHDLVSAVVEFRPHRTVELIRNNHGQLLHAAFLDHLRRFEPLLADTLHQSCHRKPFTLSPFNLSPAALRQLLPEHSYGFRITALTAEVAAALGCFSSEVAAEFMFAGEAMELGLRVNDTPWTASISAVQLVKRWFSPEQPPPRRLGLRFCSPTLCQSSNAARGLFPEPDLVFYGLAEKWLAFAAPQCLADVNRTIEAAASRAAEVLRVSRYNLATAAETFRSRNGAPPYQKIGYLGTVEYIADRRTSDAELRALGLLSAYAFFAGVGYKTTMGMGQVLPIIERNRGE